MIKIIKHWKCSDPFDTKNMRYEVFLIKTEPPVGSELPVCRYDSRQVPHPWWGWHSLFARSAIYHSCIAYFGSSLLFPKCKNYLLLNAACKQKLICLNERERCKVQRNLFYSWCQHLSLILNSLSLLSISSVFCFICGLKNPKLTKKKPQTAGQSSWWWWYRKQFLLFRCLLPPTRCQND